jgi:hypothetical protein
MRGSNLLYRLLALHRYVCLRIYVDRALCTSRAAQIAPDHRSQGKIQARLGVCEGLSEMILDRLIPIALLSLRAHDERSKSGV